LVALRERLCSTLTQTCDWRRNFHGLVLDCEGLYLLVHCRAIAVVRKLIGIVHSEIGGTFKLN
jgi:hypothetical protein